MLFRFPKNDRYYYWTGHSKSKMLQYRVSEQKIKTVLKNPARKEEGIAPRTIAIMKRNDTLKRKEEIWVMYQAASRQPKLESQKMRIISVWRYPGISPKGKKILIPEDTLAELEKITS